MSLSSRNTKSKMTGKLGACLVLGAAAAVATMAGSCSDAESDIGMQTAALADELVFTALRGPECDVESIDLRDEFEAMQTEIQSADQSEFLLSVYRKLRCISARDFKATYNRLMAQFPNPEESISLAPVMFMYFEMGARDIDFRALEWLGVASSMLQEEEQEIEFVLTKNTNLLSLPEADLSKFLATFDTPFWIGTKCDFVDIVWDRDLQPMCPEDYCFTLREIPELEEIAHDEEALMELCDFEDSNERIDATRSCLQDYASTQGQHVACIANVGKTYGLAATLNNLGDFGNVVTISDECMLGNYTPSTPDEKTLEELEAELAETERVEEYWKEQARQAQRERQIAEWVESIFHNIEAKEAKERAEEDHKAFLLEVHDATLRRLEAEDAAREARRCSPDDASCSDSCSIQDQRTQAELECVHQQFPESSDFDPSAPYDPNDPRWTDPPSDAEMANRTTLIDCLVNISETEPDSCGQQVRCTNGDWPTRNEDGLCTCDLQSSLPGPLSCDTLILCLPDQPDCQCDGTPIPGNGVPGGGVGPEPDTLITMAFFVVAPGAIDVTTSGTLAMQVLKGSTATLLSPTTGASYQWEKDGFILAGQTASTLNLAAFSNSDIGVYSVAVDQGISARTVKLSILDNSDSATSSFSDATQSFVHSQDCVDTQASMFVQSDGLTAMQVVKGSNATLSSPSVGATYVWRKDGVVISGQTVATLTIAGFSNDDSGVYSVAVDGIISASSVEIRVLDNSNVTYENDRDVLLAFNELLLGKGTLNWDAAIAIENWDGVGVENCRVTSLELRDKSLVGALPETFGNLTEMTTFDFSRNSIAGVLDMSSMSSLREAEFAITEISDFQLGSHPLMRVLNLAANPLMLPGKTLDLRSMPIIKDLRANGSGLSEILWSNSGHNAMLNLHIQDNDIIGILDLDLMPNLINVWAQNNQFTDIDFSVHTGIRTLSLGNNPLVGTRTFDISQMAILQRLYLQNLQITAIELGDTAFLKLRDFRVPGNSISELDLSLLPALQHVQVQDNQLGGIVEVANAPDINYLNIRGNQFEGTCIHPIAEATLAARNRYYYAANPCADNQCSQALTCTVP